jgi:hypothetical protein
MRISLIDHHGAELDAATVANGKDAPAEGMIMLARYEILYPGSLLSFDDDKPHQEAGTLIAVTAGNVASLAGRLEQRASVIDLVRPLSAEDLRMAARLCRHYVKAGWITTTIAI